MVANRIKIESKNSDGEPVVVYVTRPTKDELTKAQILSNKAFGEAVSNGVMVRKALDNVLTKQGVWDEDKQKRLEELMEEIRSHLLAIKEGDIPLMTARDHAIKVRIARMEMLTLQSERNSYDSYTAEGQAEEARLNYLTSVCIKDEEGKRVFKDNADYEERNGEPFAVEAAQKFLTLFYGIEENWEADLPENKFLIKYGYIDEDLRLVNKDGQYVTLDNKKINKDFQYINEDGQVVDSEGKLIDEKDGLPVVESKPFLDEDGNPVTD